MPAATSSLTPSGIGTTFFALVTTFSRQPLPPIKATTLCPSLNSVTPAPMPSTLPAISAPGEKGSGGETWYWLRRISVSKKLRPTAVTLMRTSPGPGLGSATCSRRSASGASKLAELRDAHRTIVLPRMTGSLFRSRRRLWQRRLVKTLLPPARGYFAIGIEGISKAVNLGNLLRSAHAFGASFVFTIGAEEKAVEIHHDTSKASTHLPLYHWRSLAEMRLPKGCSLVGVEILEEADELPSFPHPVRAAYVLGPRTRRAVAPRLPRAAAIWCAFRPPSR